jgi:apolipoprotein N-acyltransferase
MSPLIRIIVVAGLVAVMVSLFSALFYMYRDRGHGTRMLRMLAVRVALSAALVLFLVVSYYLGWITPGGGR